MANVFVGRERELRELEQFLDRAVAGHTQVVFIAVKPVWANLPSWTSSCAAEIGEPDTDRRGRRMQRADRRRRSIPAIPPGADRTHRRRRPEGSASRVDATNAARIKEFVRVSGETLLAVGPDLIGIFIPGAALVAKIATTAAKQSKLADKLAERVKSGAASIADSSLVRRGSSNNMRRRWPCLASSGRSF